MGWVGSPRLKARLARHGGMHPSHTSLPRVAAGTALLALAPAAPAGTAALQKRLRWPSCEPAPAGRGTPSREGGIKATCAHVLLMHVWRSLWQACAPFSRTLPPSAAAPRAAGRWRPMPTSPLHAARRAAPSRATGAPAAAAGSRRRCTWAAARWARSTRWRSCRLSGAKSSVQTWEPQSSRRAAGGVVIRSCEEV
jgi:hypothetical protein